MLASICRRRLAIPLRRILTGGGGAGTNPFRSSPEAALLLPQGYYSTTVAAASAEPKPWPAAARNVRIRDTDRANAVAALLRECGFSEAQVTHTLRYEPLLTLDPDRIILPKLDFFSSLGFEPGFVATEPSILLRSLDNHLIPCIKNLRGILGSDDNVRTAACRVPRALGADPYKIMRAVEAFLRRGLSQEYITKLLVFHLGVLVAPLDRIDEAFDYLEELGLRVTDKGFIYCFRVIFALKRETRLRKVALYQSLGVCEADVLRAIKAQPTMLLVSDEAIRKKIRFYLDVLKLEMGDVMAQPFCLSLSLEKNITPKCAVLSVLMREGKIEKKLNLLPSLQCNSKVFSKRFVQRYAKDVPDVVKAFEGHIKFQGFGDREFELFVTE